MIRSRFKRMRFEPEAAKWPVELKPVQAGPRFDIPARVVRFPSVVVDSCC